MNHADTIADPSLDQFGRRSLIVGLAALALCVVGAWVNPSQFFRSYLLGYLFWIGIGLGSLAVVMIHHLSGGAWGFVIRRCLESSTRTIPLLALMLVPVLFGLRDLYVWARPEVVAGDEVLQHKSIYLNIPFFLGRAVLYFAIWGALAYVLNKWSRQQDENADLHLSGRFQAVSGPGLAVVGLTMTFASVDWAMSLEPHWFSTIYGFLFIVGSVLATLAFVICAASVLGKREPLSAVASPDRFHDLGNLLLAFVMLWAYIAFSQYLIIWSGNLPEEIPWYVHRTGTGWVVIAIALIVFHFAVPFVLLLSRKTKRAIPALVGVAGFLLFMHFVDLFWLVAPAFSEEEIHVHWMDLMAPLGIGGVWMAAFVSQLKSRPMLPLNDPDLKKILEQQGGHT